MRRWIRRLISGRLRWTRSEDPFLLGVVEVVGAGDGECGVCGHGEGHVAVPAVVAADLAVVQATFLLRGPEAFLHRLPATRTSSSNVVSAGQQAM